jgi:5'-nucleotidase
MLAVRGLLRERPAMVVSGINHGPNLGDDVTYSGTVAAAMEGALLGLPSMAISAASWRDCRFGVAAVFARLLVLEVLKRGLPRNTLLNVNVPSVAAGEVRGVRVTRLGKRIYRDFIIKRVDPRSGRTYYLIDGEDPSWEKGKNTDFEAIEQGMISITPFHLDLTAHGHLRGFRRWERELSRGMRQLRC